MRILIADDETVPRLVLERTLRSWGHDVVMADCGLKALEILRRESPPELAVIDWMMPGLEGPAVCRQVRSAESAFQPYLILLTSRDQTHDVVAGLNSGADDYVTKPFDRAELRSRIRVGERVVGLQQHLANRVSELEAALSHVKTLHGLLPICAWCKDVRSDENYWQKVEGYFAEKANVHFTHGICPNCLEKELSESCSHQAL